MRITKEIALKIQTKNIKSKVMFNWDFKKELEKLVEETENYIWEFLWKKFEIVSTISWNNNIKIKVKDSKEYIDRIINCVFAYHLQDIRYWNLKVEIITTEMWIKPIHHIVWKFRITEKQKIKENTLKDIISNLEKIY